MSKKIFTFFMMMTALLCFSSTGMAMSYDEAYETISAQFNGSSSNLGNYDSLKAQLPDVSGNFNIMSQSDIDNVMNSYSAEIQGKYQSSISTAQANAQSSSAEAMANISARAKSIQNGVDPDTGEAYSSYIANHTPTYDADAWLSSATANLSSNISTLQGIVGEAEMPENKLLVGVQEQYEDTFNRYKELVADYESSKKNTGNSAYDVVRNSDDLLKNQFSEEELANMSEEELEGWKLNAELGMNGNNDHSGNSTVTDEKTGDIDSGKAAKNAVDDGDSYYEANKEWVDLNAALFNY